MKQFLSFRLTPHPFLLTLIVLSPLLLGSPAAVRAQWGPEVRLSSDTTQASTSLNTEWTVAASGNNVNAVFSAATDTLLIHNQIWTCHSSDGGATWGTPVPHVQQAHIWRGSPSIASSGNNFHIVYSQEGANPPYDIWDIRSTDGGATWSNPVQITNGSAWKWDPCVAVNGNNVHVVWFVEYQGDPTQYIYYQRSTDNGTTWGPATQISHEPYGRCPGMPSVAVAGNIVHVVWGYDTRNFNGGIEYCEEYYNRSTDNGTTWGGDTRLTHSPYGVRGPVYKANLLYPSVAAADSMVHVVWCDFRDNPDTINPTYEIYYLRSTDGGATFGAETRLTYDSAQSYQPNVCASGNMVHVVWFDNRGDGHQRIFYKRSADRGTTWSPDTRLTNDNPDSSSYASVAADGNMVHVVWNYLQRSAYRWEVHYIHNLTGNSGVETAGIRDQGSGIRVVARPNPFATFASVPGHEGERFALYDVSGRMVGTYRGDRIGEGLAPGVYFLRPEDKDAKPVRIVKVR